MEIEEALQKIKDLETEKEASDAKLASNTTDIASMQGKMDELLGEAKDAKQKAKDEASTAAKAIADKAKQDGDFEALLKSSESERETITLELEQFKKNASIDRVNSAATKMAAEIADGHNVALLADIIARRLKDTDTGIKVLDASGELTIDTTDKLREAVKADERYASLVRGNQSSGGSASGGDGSAVVKKFNEYSGDELKAIRDKSPAEYERIKQNR